MASAFAHALAAYTIGKVQTPKKQSAKFWILGISCSVLPDLDILAFRFGIPYMHMFGHRGITHSFFFAILLAIILVFFFFKEHKPFEKPWWLVTIYLFLCTASHGILDAMTSGGRGVAFFAPFSANRHFLPWRPIKVSPIHISDFFTDWGWKVIGSELIWVGIPCFSLLALAIARNKLLDSK